MLRSPFNHLRQLPQYANNSVMVVEGTSAETVEALRLADRFLTRHPRIGVTLVSLSEDTAPLAPTGMPRHLVKLRSPKPGLTRALLDATNPGLLLFGGLPDKRSLSLHHAAHARGCALALVTSEPITSTTRQQLCARYAFDHIFDNSGDYRSAVEDEKIKALRDLTRRQVRNVAFSRRRKTVIDWIAAPFDRRRFPGIDSLEQLNRLLGNPATLMCLGNGPSSESPELSRMPFDALFRVNSRWAARGRLLNPDLIFTNQQMAVRRLRPRVGFVVRSAADQQYLRWKLRWRVRHLRLGAADHLHLHRTADCCDVVPSTGLLMLSAAVALQPKRMIVAGIDLFSDKSGAYPGDNRTLNAYSLDHDRDTERRLLIALLDRYHGELIVVGDVLRAAIADRSDSRNHALESVHP